MTSPAGPCPLDDRTNIAGTRLKSHLRFGILWLMDRVASVLGWPEAGTHCLLCRSGYTENAQHFLTECTALRLHRAQLRRVLAHALPRAGAAGRAILDQYNQCAASDPVGLLALLAGTVP